MGRTPERGTVLRGEDGLALVVADNTDPLDALLELLDIEYGGEFSRTNPVLVKEADDLKVEVWRYCTKAFCEAECIGDDPDQDWWAPHGDGARSIHVVSVERSIWVIGEEAEAAEMAPLGDLMAQAERDRRPSVIAPRGGGAPHSERGGKCVRDGDVWPCTAAMAAGVQPHERAGEGGS